MRRLCSSRLPRAWAVLALTTAVSAFSGCSAGSPDPAPPPSSASASASAQQTSDESPRTPPAPEATTTAASDLASTWLLVTANHMDLIRADGTGRHTAVPSVDAAGHAKEFGLGDFSPDGSQIAFMQIIRASDPKDLNRAVLWVARSDGSRARRIFPCDSCAGTWAPAWSPDGTHIAYAWARYDKARGVFVGSGVAIGDLASGRTRIVLEAKDASYGVDLVRWSGDGRRLVVTMGFSADPPRTPPNGSAVAVISASGPPTQQPRRLTPASIAAGFADWDHRSGRILYSTNVIKLQGDQPTGDGNIFTMKADGSDVRPVTTFKAADAWAIEPSWTPDGRIVFNHCIDRRACYVSFVDSDGSHLQLGQKVTGGMPRVRPE